MIGFEQNYQLVFTCSNFAFSVGEMIKCDYAVLGIHSLREHRFDSMTHSVKFLITLSGLLIAVAVFLLSKYTTAKTQAADHRTLELYESQIKPILEAHCYQCHGAGAKEGGFELDHPSNLESLMADQELWSKVLKNVRASVMPPSDEKQPSADQVAALASWIKQGPFKINPHDIDPGRITIHRLNRLEYRNTIFDLLGVYYNTDDEFPPDAAGLGLDNISDLLTMSPLMMEKYIDAAEIILDGSYPSHDLSPIDISGKTLAGDRNTTGESYSFNNPPELTYTFRNKTPGTFRLKLELDVVGLSDDEKKELASRLEAQEQERLKKEEDEKKRKEAKEKGETLVEEPTPPVRGRFGSGISAEPPPLKPVTEARFVVSVQSGATRRKAIIDKVFSADPESYTIEIEESWCVEPHKIDFNVIMPGNDEPTRQFGFGRSIQPRKPLPAPRFKINSLEIAQQQPEASRRFFPLDQPPKDSTEFRQYAKNGLAEFGLRAIRRPLDNATLNALTDEVVTSYQESSHLPDSIKGVLAKLLCSPRFLFRIASVKETKNQEPWGLIDEYSLASRLSYFLWSCPPDDELLDLARRGKLRANLNRQIERMLSNFKLQNFIENFSGQWLQSRNVMNWSVIESAVLDREGIRSRSTKLTDSVRQAMVQEVKMYFEYVLKENRSVLEFIDSDYTFLNAELARYYEIQDIQQPEMKHVKLPAGHLRGGLITAGSTLLVTSTTNRTSPVKRGVFVLDNFLGMRPHDPPPDIPSVDAASAGITDHKPSFREMLELHRKDSLCASCHNLMDPIGLGLDQFNAMGMYREKEYGEPIDTSGKLASGEAFADIKELKGLLLGKRRQDFYRCLTNKLMSYALGRGLVHADTETTDQIVAQLELDDGRFSTLLTGIINSVPFQKQRSLEPQSPSSPND